MPTDLEHTAPKLDARLKKKKMKKLSRGQRMIAGQAGNKLKIESADFAALRRKRRYALMAHKGKGSCGGKKGGKGYKK